MENNKKGIAWFGSMYKKLEDMCLEITNDLMGEVEQLVGVHVTQFCSDFIEGVLHSPSSEAKLAVSDSSLVENSDVLTQEMLNGGSDEDLSENEPSNVDHSLSSSSVEHIKSHSDSSFEQNVDVCQKSEGRVKENANNKRQFQIEGMQFDFSLEQAVDMCEKPELSVEENPIKEKQTQLEISALDNQAEVLLPASDDLTGSNSSMGTEEGSGNLEDAAASVSSALPSSISVILLESCDSKVPDTEIIPGCPSSESIRVEEISGDVIAEEAGDNGVTKVYLKIVHSSENAKLEESCFAVDSNDFCCASCETPKQPSLKIKIQKAFASKMRLTKKQAYEANATCCGDLDAGTNKQNGQTYALSIITKSSDSAIAKSSDSMDDDWEII